MGTAEGIFVSKRNCNNSNSVFAEFSDGNPASILSTNLVVLLSFLKSKRKTSVEKPPESSDTLISFP